jgi:hypothetical protein
MVSVATVWAGSGIANISLDEVLASGMTALVSTGACVLSSFALQPKNASGTIINAAMAIIKKLLFILPSFLNFGR